LRKWQGTQRLVGSSDPAWVIDNLFLDSLLFLRVMPSNVSTVADLGSGAGFPGIPIKIVKPDINLTLIESRQRRVSFLATVVRELPLSRTRLIASRAESMGDPWRGAFDVVLVRCAGDMARILPIASKLAGADGCVIFADSPGRRSDERCERVEVAGARSGTTRAFAVFRNTPETGPPAV
jgi:16S rRNA (guanine527-N7)-methyltransferase